MTTPPDSMRYRFWTPEKVAQLIALNASGLGFYQIATVMHKTPRAISTKMTSLGLVRSVGTPRVNSPKLRLEMVSFPTFEDVAQPDRDKHTGRKPPLRGYAGSVVGCAAEMCAGT